MSDRPGNHWRPAQLEAMCQGAALSVDEAEALIGTIMDGGLDDVHIAALLIALKAKGVVVGEVVGAARAMRARALRVTGIPAGAIDTCGTGGDGSGTFNISTCAALLVAAAGVPVAKHGNRSVSSRSGSADVLEALGVPIDLGPAGVAFSLREFGFGFMFAPRYHAAMRHVAPVRRALGVRTLFNILGPLTNPAAVHRQVTGAFSVEVAALHAQVLLDLGAERALAVHGAGGLDELGLVGPNRVFELRDGRVETWDFAPEDAGLERRRELPLGGDAKDNAGWIERVLAGEGGVHFDAALLNAGAALYVAGVSESIAAGVGAAREVVDAGAATALLNALRAGAARARAADREGST